MIKMIDVNGQEIEVWDPVARPGFGSIRRAKYEGVQRLVKYYSREDLKGLDKIGTYIYDNLKACLGQESPGRAFLWPAAVSEQKQGFCYVLDGDLSSFLSLSDLMEEKGKYDGWSAIANAALHLTEAFLQMKKRHGCYGYLTEDDIFIHPKTGRVLIANTEFLQFHEGGRKSGKSQTKSPAAPLSCTCRLLPPECISRQKEPDGRAADYMLSVLLFELLYLHHPLEGYKGAACPAVTEDMIQKVYGTSPCYVFDPEDESNRPVRGIHVNVLRRASVYPEMISRAFEKAFSRKALTGKEPFMTAEEWYQIFLAFRSCVYPCTCGMETIWQPGAETQVCRKCRSRLASPALYYKIGAKSYPILPGGRIFRAQLDPSADDSLTTVGELIRTKADSSLCLLQNSSRTEWTITDKEGNERQMGPQETIAPAEGMKIRADDKIIEISGKYI